MSFIKKETDTIEKRVRRIEIKSTYAKIGIFLLFLMWIFILEFTNWNQVILNTITDSLVLAIGSYFIFYYLIGIFVSCSGTGAKSEEVYGDEKRKLTVCLDCMLVYDAKRLRCPECGKETQLKNIEQLESKEDMKEDE